MSQGTRRLQLYERIVLRGGERRLADRSETLRCVGLRVATAIIHDTRKVSDFPIVNMSEGGIFLSEECTETFDVGQVVMITIRGSIFMEPIQLKGKVVRKQRSRPKGIAIEFTTITSTTRNQLSASLEGIRIESTLNGEKTYVK